MLSRKIIVTLLIVFAIALFTNFHEPMFNMNQASWLTLGLLLIMITLWVTEFIPLGVTAILPVLYAPLVGIDNLKTVASSYGNPIMFLCLGGFLLGIAMQKWNLNKRISLIILNKMGTNPRNQMIGFMMIATFFSMWLSNATTVIILLPVALAIISYPSTDEGLKKALLLAIAYCASLGGMGTLIGTPPNAFLKGFLENEYHIKISFLDWMILAMPLVIFLALMTYFILVFLFKIKNTSNIDNNMQYNFKDEIKKLGKMSFAEKAISIIFFLTALSWGFKEKINSILYINLTDEMISLITFFTLFLVPVNIKEKIFLVDIESFKKIPWDIIILLGGGFALSQLLIKSGLSLWIAENLTFIGIFNIFIIIFIIVLFIVIITEFSSNVAITATFLPVLVPMAIQFDVSPLFIAIPVTLSASCAFMLPSGTATNAVIFGSGQIRIIDMIKGGAYLSLVAIIFLPIYCYYMIPLIFK